MGLETEGQQPPQSRFPEGYTDFSTVLEKQTEIKKAAIIGLRDPLVFYANALHVLAALMDRETNARLVGQGITGDRYEEELWKSSAYPAISAAQQDEDVTKRYLNGRRMGGDHLDWPGDYGVLNPVIGSLSQLDGRLLHKETIRNLWINNKAAVGAQVHQLKIFAENGLGAQSPLVRLLLLSELELDAKRHMINPVIRMMERYSKKNPIRFASEDPAGIQESKKRLLKRLFEGVAVASYNQRPERYKENPEWLLEDRLGTEFYRGYYELVVAALKKVAVGSFGEDAGKVLFLIKQIAFMKTSIYPKEKFTDLKTRLIEPLAKGDFTQAFLALRNLILEFPDLYPAYIRREKELAITQEEINAHQGLLRQQREAFAGQIAAGRRRLSQARELERRSRYLQKDTERRAEGRRPELWEEITPYVGETLQTAIPETTVVIKGQATMTNPHSKKVQSGYAQVVFVSDPPILDRVKGPYPLQRGAIITYGEVLKRIASGEWKLRA